MIPRKAVFIIFSLLFVSFVFITLRIGSIRELAATKLPTPKLPEFLFGSDSLKHDESDEFDESACTEDLGWLDAYDFSSPFFYASRKISTNYVSDVTANSFTLVEKPLFSTLQELDLTKVRSRSSQRCEKSIVVDVLAPPPTANASHIIFGLQTTIQRLSDTVIHLARWLPDTGAQLYAVVIESEGVPASEELMKSVQSRLRAEGIVATVVHPEFETDSFPQRYFSLVNIMDEHRTPETEWVVLMDDDTFIPSMPALLETLAIHDSSVPQYLGSLSENWGAVNIYGLMGFGGAGIYLSTPLVSLITTPKTYSHCKNEMTTSAGDVATMNCIYENTPYKLTHIPALHQLDIFGDVSGFFESGRPMLSLHHWKGAFDSAFPMAKMHLIADLCDAADCFLRRWQFQDKFVLSNGFSLSQYPQGETVKAEKGSSWFWNKDEEEGPARVVSYVGPMDLNELERTWYESDVMNVRHSLEPTRLGLEVGRDKLQHRLIDAVRVGDEIRQVYFGKAGDGLLDTVLVLYWSKG